MVIEIRSQTKTPSLTFNTHELCIPKEKPSLWTSHTFSVPNQARSAAICSSVFTCKRRDETSRVREGSGNPALTHNIFYLQHTLQKTWSFTMATSHYYYAGIQGGVKRAKHQSHALNFNIAGRMTTDKHSHTHAHAHKNGGYTAEKVWSETSSRVQQFHTRHSFLFC